ncbi:hypothetical protein MMC10_010952 [Thelotrema lepadinum]|nr:hypothetical protein [Thelotrema lepadinum]
MTPLIAAIEHLPDLAEQLIDAGASVHTLQADGKSPLVAAMQSGRHDTIERLLEAGADIEVIYGGLSLLALAVQISNCRHIVELLLEAGANPNLSGPTSLVPPLVLAATLHDTSIVSTLMEAGACVDEQASRDYDKRFFSKHNKDYKTNYKGESFVQTLEANAAVNALQLASIVGNRATVGLLLYYGADPMAETAKDQNALYLAALYERHTIVEQFVTFGDQTHQGAEAVRRAVSQALVEHNTDALRMLISHGVKPNMAHPELRGRTGLQYAIDTKDKAMEDLLHSEVAFARVV